VFGPVRLIGIDAPEMPGHCRAGRVCTPGDGAAARDVLAQLIGPHERLHCRGEGRDAYGRLLARCRAGGRDLSCAMIARGQAVARYRAIDCKGQR
jgi:endonuclease YncB( thermonuclease family)